MYSVRLPATECFFTELKMQITININELINQPQLETEYQRSNLGRFDSLPPSLLVNDKPEPTLRITEPLILNGHFLAAAGRHQ